MKCRSLLVAPDFVKTSTGYGSGGATNEDLQLDAGLLPFLYPHQGRRGHSGLDRLLEVLDLGATRVGATATVAILEEAANRFK